MELFADTSGSTDDNADRFLTLQLLLLLLFLLAPYLPLSSKFVGSSDTLPASARRIQVLALCELLFLVASWGGSKDDSDEEKRRETERESSTQFVARGGCEGRRRLVASFAGVCPSRALARCQKVLLKMAPCRAFCLFAFTSEGKEKNYGWSTHKRTQEKRCV